MNSVGQFREGEINGVPFYLFNFLSQTDSPASSSSSSISDLSPLQPLFICQSDCFIRRILEDPDGKKFIPVDIYPHLFSSKRIREHECKLPLVPLFWCNNKEQINKEFRCRICNSNEVGTDYYICVDKCGQKFHKECIEAPLEIKHPSYPFTSLKLYYSTTNGFGILSCFSCHKDIRDIFYYCPTSTLSLHPVCALKPIPIFINHPKRHPHPLTFFPRQAFLPCNVCGLIKEYIPTYVCARCVFVVHQDCIYHPYVIKISRHHHRISFTYSLPSREFSCGVCRRKVDNNYGAYSCNKCDDYFVHTKCALRRDLWDGKELEGVPEEPEVVVEPPFKKISNGVILHFSHDHHLKLETNKVYEEGKLCQGCILPFYHGSYYSCMDQCDFNLHDACANAPRGKQHALCAVSLKLKVFTREYNVAEKRKRIYNVRNGKFDCDACDRPSCGFFYEDPIKWRKPFTLDLRCASVSEPFKYQGHKHPLFLALTPEEEKEAICHICQEENLKKLNCIECSFVICFACATLPYKVRYKHDKHLLTFREKEQGNDQPGWCDICERKLMFSRKGGFYSCDEYCSTTVHVDCLLGGEDMYVMKPGQNMELILQKVQTLGNKTMSRPLCHGKEHRCPHKVVFKKDNKTFCSSDCCKWYMPSPSPSPSPVIFPSSSFQDSLSPPVKHLTPFAIYTL